MIIQSKLSGINLDLENKSQFYAKSYKSLLVPGECTAEIHEKLKWYLQNYNIKIFISEKHSASHSSELTIQILNSGLEL